MYFHILASLFVPLISLDMESSWLLSMLRAVVLGCGCSLVVGYLLSMYKAPGLIPSATKQNQADEKVVSLL